MGLLQIWGLEEPTPKEILFNDGHKIAKQLGITESKLAEVIDVLKGYKVLR